VAIMQTMFPNYIRLMQDLADAWLNNVGPERKAGYISFYFVDEDGKRGSPNMDTGTMLDYLLNDIYYNEEYNWKHAYGVKYDNG